MITKIKQIVVILLLCLQVMPFSLVFAETIEDTPTSETSGSSILNDPLEANGMNDEQKQPIEPQVEDPVLSYEDQTFLEQENPDSVIPAVLLDEKNLNKEVLFRGKVTAGSEKQGANHSIVKLKSLILQRAKDDADWEDHHVFTVNNAGVNLTATDYIIDFSETVDDPGSYQYRLIMDYEVESFEGGKLIGSSEKKGSLELGLVEVVEETKEELNPIEIKDSSVIEKAEPDESTSSSVAEPTVESEEKNKVDEQNKTKEEKEEEPLAPPPLETSPSMVPSKAASQELPELQDNYRQAFQRGMGIMPLASNNAVIDYYREEGNTGGVYASDLCNVTPLVIHEIKYTSKTKFKIVLKFSFHYQEKDSRGENYVDYNLVVRTTYLGTYLETGKIPANQYVTKERMQTINQGEPYLGNLTNTTSRGTGTHGNFTYPRIENDTTLEFLNFPANGQLIDIEVGLHSYGFNKTNYSHRRMLLEVRAPSAVDLTAISTPSFTAIDGNVSTVNMAAGTYTGDISDNLNDGVLQISTNNGSSWSNHISNLNHTNSRNGTYAARSVGSLTAGSEYLGRVAFKDWLGSWKYSGNRVFYTPNSVNQPGVPILNTPTTASNATAAFTATYNTGTRAAHASSVEVQRSTNNSTWTTVSATPSITTSSKQVKYTLSGLAPNTTYYTRYRVKNASTKWSPWSTSRSFVTKGVALKISTPSVNQAGATVSQIVMNSGTYTGNTSTNTADKNTGIVRISANNGGTWTNKTTTLVHGTTFNGNYNGLTITGLAAGSTYKLQVRLKDAARAYQDSALQTFHTPNTANAPGAPTLNTPTTATNATASFVATYVAGTTPAHPTGTGNVEVKVSENGGTFNTASLNAAPTVTTGSKQVSFFVKSLKAKTNYRVQYRVRNASGVWSNWATSASFKTKGIGLTVNPPVFDQNTATSSTIQMKPGTYTGDISQAGNTGEVYTESYNMTGSGGTKDWLKKADITHDKTTNGNYSGALITGLDAGTSYRGWVRMKDYEGQFSPYVMTTSPYFYTTNTVNPPSVTSMGTPTTPFDASVSLSGQYVVGTKTGQTPAHPDQMKVRISLDDTNWTEVNSTTTPKLSTSTINTGSTAANFSLENLKTNTKYYVQYRVKNQGGWSEWSASEDFTTAAPPAGIYLLEHPTLDFGMLEKELFSQTANLSTNSVKNHVVIDNTLTSSGWTLSAKLENLARTTDASVMPWATLRMDINLQNTTDNGGTWNDYTTGVTGAPRTLTLNAGDPAQNLWSISNAADAQGTFRNEIDWSSVELEVPGNLEGYYQGKLVWSLDSIP